MNLTGHKLGKYKLLEPLGRGGMAQVYKAFQPGIERFVAIKTLHSHLADSDDFVARFQREARNIGRLMHPNIVRLMDFDSDADLQYMVFDYIQHDTLEAYLKNNPKISIEKALQVTFQVAKALAYAHEQGVIHRDIKPGNIMFTDAQHSHVVLTDFGLAYLLDETQMLTMTGMMLGTPSYMSPEAIRGARSDERSDIYSLGVVLFQMLTGTVPYEADTPYALMTKLSNDPMPIPRQLNPSIPPAVERLIMRAMAKDANDRFQSGAEFCQALQQAQRLLRRNGLPVNLQQSTSSTSQSEKKPNVKSGIKEVKGMIKTFSKKLKQLKLPRANRWVSLAASGASVLVIALMTAAMLTGFGSEGIASSAIQVTSAATHQTNQREERPASRTIKLERHIVGERVRNSEDVNREDVESGIAPLSTASGTIAIPVVRSSAGNVAVGGVQRNVANQTAENNARINENRPTNTTLSETVAPAPQINTDRANNGEGEIIVPLANDNPTRVEQNGSGRQRERGNNGRSERRNGQRSQRGNTNG